MADLEHQIRSQLHTDADLIKLPTADPQAAVARSRRIRRQAIAARATVATALLLIIGGAAWFVSATDVDDPSTSQFAQQGELDTPAPAAVEEFALSWEERSSPFAGFSVTGSSLGTASSADTLYVLSTAPAVAGLNDSFRQAIYSSDDGISWTPQVLDRGALLSDIVTHDGVVYGLSTSPGTRAGSVDVLAVSSRDGGGTWDSTVLPFEVPVAEGDGWLNARRSVAAGDGGVLAALTYTLNVDPRSVLPPEFAGSEDVFAWFDPERSLIVVESHIADCLPEEAIEEVPDDIDGSEVGALGGAEGTTEESVEEAVGDAPCGPPEPVREFTLAELGLQASDLAATTSTLLWSADGADFEPIDGPLSSVEQVLAVDDGFFALASAGADDPLSVWRSADGRTWEETAGGPVVPRQEWGWVGNRSALLGEVAGRPMVVTREVGVLTAWTVGDTGEWIASALPIDAGDDFWVSAFEVESDGAAIVVREEAAVTLLVTLDGVSWQTVDIASLRPGAVDEISFALIARGQIILGATEYRQAGPVHSLLVGTVE